MKLKKCPRCFEPKSITGFTKDISQKDGLSVYCKEHKKEIAKKYHINFPWKRTLEKIKQRCENPNDKNYKYYGDKEIKNYLTLVECEYMYNRDNAWDMNNPSIDRKDNDKHYTLDNCEFIEMTENSAKDKRKSILQLDLDDKFIKEWKSATEVEIKLKISRSHISQCCNNKKYKSVGGFKWRFKNV